MSQWNPHISWPNHLVRPYDEIQNTGLGTCWPWWWHWPSCTSEEFTTWLCGQISPEGLLSGPTSWIQSSPVPYNPCVGGESWSEDERKRHRQTDASSLHMILEIKKSCPTAWQEANPNNLSQPQPVFDDHCPWWGRNITLQTENSSIPKINSMNLVCC